ncbi:MAG TPA: alanine--tRNA ligase [Gemmatimonadales bacterium]|nr:alanine--tRNA ligase [Gemmatimonadales bacterium]
MQAHRIRRLFLDYFADRGHQEVPSSSLVPADDPTLLFTNSGMVQFKRLFLGQEQRDYQRAITCQKCVRAGGKHNDLEQVGHTKRHHTFFEMLGNFSFGDYFKDEAIEFAWEFVTSEQFLGLHPDRLWVTVHHSDDEARGYWRSTSGLPDSRIFGLGDQDNFWQMGDTGPCGPCSEIYVDLEWKPGSVVSPHAFSQAEFESMAEAGRFLEIWNLVFMQFDRSADGTLTPLPRPSVDTGAGLERIASVLQDVDDNFHIDLFLPLLDQASQLVGAPYPRSLAGPGGSYRVLADHARAVAFLLTDGVYPSNEGRGYVLRRILRRAVRHAWLLGRKKPTLAPLTQTVVDVMGEVYPDLIEKREFIREVTLTEEERFLETIEGGLRRLEELFASGVSTIPGEEAFRLYDTFGFPVDLTQLIAAERGVGVDAGGFEGALEGQRSRSRAARQPATGPLVQTSGRSKSWRSLKRGRQKFVGYETTEAETDLLAVREDADRLELLLHRNPFYVESGGQVSDIGFVEGDSWSLLIDEVKKDERGTVVAGPLGFEGFDPGDVRAVVDTPRRRNIERNHSATHLVHWALRKHLGSHVRQQGSLVEPGRLRFDFTHHGPLDPAQVDAIERDVNQLIWENTRVDTREMPLGDALALGAMAFFSEKYGDLVRVVTMGPSIELCGGTHVRSTGALGLFRITSQGGVAAGVRRIEAVTGPVAYEEVDRLKGRLEEVATALKAQPEHVARRIEQLLAERAKLEARLAEALKSGGGSVSREDTLEVGGVRLTLGETSMEDRDELGQVVDRFRSGRERSVLVLFGTAGRGAVHVAVSDDLVRQGRKAGDLVNRIAAVSGGRGGGRPHFASAGAGDPERLDEARSAAPHLVAEWLRA